MSNGIPRRALLAAAMLGLAGCGSSPPPPRFPALTYDHRGKIGLKVASIEIEESYQPPLAPPNIDHIVPARPRDAMRRWAQDRLAASGTPGLTGRFTIVDAKVVETQLARTGGVRGVFTTDQAQRFDGTLTASLEIVRWAGGREGFATATVTRFRTLREGATLNERDKLLYELVESLMADFDAEFERQIRLHLATYVS